MKKLKVLLIVLLAGLMSLALFACKKGGTNNPGGETPGGETPGGETPGDNDPNKPGPGEPEPTGDEIASVSAVDPIEFTESATAADLAAEVAKITMRIRTGDGPSTIKGDACTIEDATNIQWGTVGSYNVNLLPTENNPREYFARLTVNIVHDFDDDGVCKDCKATISTEELEEGQTPETVTFIAFHNDGHTLTAGDKSFVTRYGTAPTYTPGRLTKGTKIVVKGTAKTSDAEGATWNFPVIGFADSNTGDYDYGAGTGTGSSVLIRNDSWVLYNGIGTPRMLGGIAGGTNENKNYGSTVEGTNQPNDYLDWTQGTRYTEGVPYTTANWKDWYVYSVGDPLYSQDYLEEAEVEITWEYRYDGVIVTSICTNDDTTLTSYTKVPDNNQGYYDAILHGELMVYKLKSITVTNPLTLTALQVTATPKQNDKDYLANQMLNFEDVTVQAKYEQKGDAWQDVDQFEVYGMVEGTGSQTMTVGDDTFTGTLYNLSNSPLRSDMTRYFVVLSVGKTTKTLAFAAEDFVGVYANAVDSIEGLIVLGVESFVNDASGADAYTHTGEGNVTIKLTGYAGTGSDEAIEDYFPDTTDTHFVAFNVYAKAGGDKFTIPSTAQNGMLKSDRYMIMVDSDGSMMQVIITMKKGDVPEIEIEGLQDGKIKFDLSAIGGLDATSTLELPDNFALNEGGEVSVVYEFEAGTVDATTMWTVSYAGGNAAMFFFATGIPANGTKNGNITLMSATDKDGNAISNWATATSLKLTFKVAGISLNAAIGDYVIQLYKGGNVLARAMFTYDGSFNDNVAGDKGAVIEVSDAESSVGTRASWYAQRVGDKLYLAKVFWDEWVAESDIEVNDFTLNFNAGNQDKIVYFDLSGKLVYGEYVFNNNAYNDEDYEGMTVALYFNEYDFGNFATLVFTIDLSKLEDQGVEGVYNFVHTDIYEEGDNYFYYSATANGVEIKTVAKTATSKSDVEPGCEQAGAALTGIKSGENFTFLIHVDYTPQHDFTKDANDFYVCDDDGAFLWSGDATNVGVAASYFANAVAKSGVQDAASLVDTGLTISFAVQAGNDWNSDAISTASGGMSITMPNLSAWSVSAGKNGTDEMKALATALAKANAFPGFNGQDNAQNGHAWDAFITEKSYATVVISKTEGISYYRNGELAIRYNPNDYLNYNNSGAVDEEVNAQVKQFAELFLLLTETYGLKLGTGSTVTTMEDVLVEARTADDDACELLYLNYNRSATFYPADSEKGGIYSENQEPTATNPIVIECGGWAGWAAEWIGRPIEYGKVVTISGTMNSKAGEVWHLPILFLFSGDAATKGTLFRLDGWFTDVIEAGTTPSFVSVTLDGTKYDGVGKLTNPTWKAMLAATPAAEIKISWLNATKITVEFKMTATISDEQHVAVLTCEMTPTGEAFTQTAFNIGLGGENMTYTITSITRAEGELHEHQYSEENDRCPDDGALDPEHQHNYDATTGDCKCGEHQHVYTAETDRCAKDGELNPEHEHDFTNGDCKCGERDPNHVHNFGEGTTCGCGAVLVEIGGKEYAFDEIAGYKNNDTTAADWFAGATDDIVKSGDFAIYYTWENTRDPNYYDLALELQFNFGGADKDGHFIDFDQGNQWTAEYVTGTAPAVSGSTEGTQGAPGTANASKGTYRALITRVGTTVTVIIEFTADGSETVTWTRTATATGCETGETHIRINGNPYWFDNIKAYTGTEYVAPSAD